MHSSGAGSWACASAGRQRTDAGEVGIALNAALAAPLAAQLLLAAEVASRYRPCCRRQSRGFGCRSGAGCSTRSSAPRALGPPPPPPGPAFLQGSPTLWCACAYFSDVALIWLVPASMASMHLPSPSPLLLWRGVSAGLTPVHEHPQASAALGQEGRATSYVRWHG